MPGLEPRLDIKPTKSMQLSIIYIEGHLLLLFQIIKWMYHHFPFRFFMVMMMMKGWHRADWTGWCWRSLSACCHTTFRMASTFDLRSWAVEMVSG